MSEYEPEVVTACILIANKVDTVVSPDQIHMLLTSLDPDISPTEPIEEVQVHHLGQLSEKGETKIIVKSGKNPTRLIVVPPLPLIPDWERLARHIRERVEFDPKIHLIKRTIRYPKRK